MNRKIGLVFSILLTAIRLSYGQNLMDYGHSLRYADFLFQNKEYTLSAQEYERITRMEPNDTSSMLKLIQSYRLKGDIRQAESKLERMFSNVGTNLPEPFALERIRIFYKNGQFKECRSFLQKNSTMDSTERVEYEVRTLLMLNEWNSAKKLSENYLLIHSKTAGLGYLYDIACQGAEIKLKKPSLASALSAIIPGAGKVYTGQWKDGGYAFLFVSAFSLLTYESAKKGGLCLPTVLYGSMALSFYAANIYGSFQSAVRQNRRAKHKLTANLEL
jgi:hypothetical protein